MKPKNRRIEEFFTKERRTSSVVIKPKVRTKWKQLRMENLKVIYS